MISTNEFKTGYTIEVDGEIYSIVEFQHVKPGKGAAFVRTKLKNLRTQNVIEKTFRAGEKVERAHIEHRQMQYLYPENDFLVMMDTDNFEQLSIPKEKIGEDLKWLKENMVIEVLFYKGDIIGVELPHFVDLEVIETEPGIRGDTATAATKNAVLETGATIQVPLFVEKGDLIRVDTRTGEYLTRV